MSDVPTLEVRDLVKHFKKAPPEAGLNGLSFSVPRGTICGLIGPNGAGKTTTVRVLSTLTRADSGTARVAGFDVATEGRRVREHIGFVGQQAAVDEVLDGRQNLVLFARLRRFAPREARRTADELLERFGLREAGKTPVSAYSGGMRRRLDLSIGLLTDPAVLFVDEPTTGLDPAGRREVWTALAGLAERGTTILLTTHMLDEAEELAGRLVFIQAGRVVAEGTPDALKSRFGEDRVETVRVRPSLEEVFLKLMDTKLPDAKEVQS